MRTVVFLLAFFILPGHVIIKTYPIVYRADSRHIDALSQAGELFPWGREHSVPDTDLIRHFEGESLEERGSIFVSTSSSLAEVIRHAASLARPNSEEPFDRAFSTFVYAIRPADNFYNVEASIVDRRNTLPRDASLRTRLDRLLHDYGGMEELVAVNGIPFDRILNYIRIDGELLNHYGVSPGSPILSETYWINRWEKAGTRYNTSYDRQTSSPQPYSIVAINAEPTGSRLMVRNGTEDEVPLSFSCKGVGDRSATRPKRAIGSFCLPQQSLRLYSAFYDRGLLLALTETVP